MRFILEFKMNINFFENELEILAIAIYIQSEYKRKELAFWQTFIVF